MGREIFLEIYSIRRRSSVVTVYSHNFRSKVNIMDFLASADKLSKEQARRRDEAKKKLAEERSAAERQRQRAIAETQLRADILRRAQEEADEKRLAHEREALLTGGIRFEETLIAFSRDDLEEDRICLPQQALETLTSQDAMSNGVMLFRISRLEDGKIISTSHCGVREFSAAEGTCILPVSDYFFVHVLIIYVYAPLRLIIQLTFSQKSSTVYIQTKK